MNITAFSCFHGYFSKYPALSASMFAVFKFCTHPFKKQCFHAKNKVIFSQINSFTDLIKALILLKGTADIRTETSAYSLYHFIGSEDLPSFVSAKPAAGQKRKGKQSQKIKGYEFLLNDFFKKYIQTGKEVWLWSRYIRKN